MIDTQNKNTIHRDMDEKAKADLILSISPPETFGKN